MGYNTKASGYYSTAIGPSTTASNSASTAMGRDTTANGIDSTAIGYSTIAYGDHSTAMGAFTTASGTGSTTMGEYTYAVGDASTAMGYMTTADGDYSTAMGRGTTVYGAYSIGIGLTYNGPNWVVNDASVMAIMGGKVGIGTTSPAYPLDVEGYIQAYGYYTGDIIFQKNGKQLWRMYEDENGLYAQSFITGKNYKFVLEETNTPELNIQEAIKNLQQENQKLQAQNQLLAQRLETIELTLGIK